MLEEYEEVDLWNEEILQSQLYEQEMRELVEATDLAFENACKDQIDISCTKERLIQMVEEIWSKYVKEDKPVLKWISSTRILFNKKIHDMYCGFADGCFLFKEEGTQNILVLQNGKILQDFFSMELNRAKDVLAYIDAYPDLDISIVENSFEQLCMDALKRGEFYPHIYKSELLSEVKNSITFIQNIAMKIKKNLSWKKTLNFMATVNEGFIEVEEKDFSSLAHLYPTRVREQKGVFLSRSPLS